jgi:hypothetical protein
VQEFVLFVMGDLLGMFLDCIQKSFVSQSGWWRRQPKWRQKQVKLADREDVVSGWQDLKTESGDIVDSMPRSKEEPPALRTMPFQEGEDVEDISTPG